jgi:hypothetical protein
MQLVHQTLLQQVVAVVVVLQPVPAVQEKGKRILVTRITNNPNRPANNAPANTNVIIVGTNSTTTPGNSVNKTTVVNNNASTKTDAVGGVVATLTNPDSEANKAKNGVQVTAANTNNETALDVDKNVPASVNVSRSEKDNSLQVQALKWLDWQIICCSS